ncbi:MAG: hypothetical protein IK017_11075, partial [Paludibacteraceae bacterium]|nr:hypothetical protein [Paludibacteraceae bacterium]
RNPADWTVNVVKGRATRFGRGYCMHEHIHEFGLIDMGGRIYDAHTHQFLTPDPYMQAPDSWLSHNRYAYCMQNPVMYTDPDGEMAWFVPVIIGAVIGTYSGGALANNGELNPLKWDYSSGQTWGYMLGGSIAGAVSGFCGSMVTASEIPFANTLSIVASSFTNSALTHVYTGGDAPVSVNFGFGSYNFSNNSFGFLGKKGNTALENVGYAFGALANVRDVNGLFDKTKVRLYIQTEEDGHFDKISHSAVVSDEGESMMSYGPAENPTKAGYKGFAFGKRSSTSNYNTHINTPGDKTINSDMFIVNKRLFSAMRNFSEHFPYRGITSNCVNWASISLWLNGIPNVGIHPFLLHGSMFVYNTGIYNMLSSQMIK